MNTNNSNNSPNLLGPYSIADLCNNGFNKKKTCSGIYLWGVKVGSTYYPLYVGKSRNISERIFQHLSSFTGGEYLIPDQSTITDPNRNIIKLIQQYIASQKLPHGLIYFPTGDFCFFNNPQNTQTQQTIQFVKDHFFVCWKEINPYDNITASIEEGNLADAIGRGKLISSRYGIYDKSKVFIADFLKLSIS